MEITLEEKVKVIAADFMIGVTVEKMTDLFLANVFDVDSDQEEIEIAYNAVLSREYLRAKQGEL